MKVSIDDLKKRYETLDTDELLALKNDGLTETALSVLEEELSKRKLPEEESEKSLEGVNTKHYSKFYNRSIELFVFLFIAFLLKAYLPSGLFSTLYYNVFHPYQYYLEKGVELSKKGEYSQAIQEMLVAREKAPNNYLVYHLLGTTYVRLNQIDKAKECFEKVIALSPKPDSDADVCIATGGAYLWLGDTDKAEQLLRKAIHLYEKDGKTQRAEKARRALEHIKEVSP